MRAKKVTIKDFASFLEELAARGARVTKVVAYVDDPTGKVTKVDARLAPRAKRRRYWRPVEKRLVQWFKMRAGRDPKSHEELLFTSMWATDWRDDPHEGDRRQREARRYFIAEAFDWRCPHCGDRVGTLSRWVCDLREFAGRCDGCKDLPMVKICQ